MNNKAFSPLVVIFLAIGFIIVGGMVWYFSPYAINQVPEVTMQKASSTQNLQSATPTSQVDTSN